MLEPIRGADEGDRGELRIGELRPHPYKRALRYKARPHELERHGALQDDPALDKISGYAEDSGEGRWTVEQAIEHAVPMPAISASLFARFASRQSDSPTMKAVAALRNQFGGHAVQAVEAAEPAEAESPA